MVSTDLGNQGCAFKTRGAPRELDGPARKKPQSQVDFSAKGGPGMSELPKADRRGTTILVPLGIGVVFVVVAGRMLLRNNSPDDRAPPPNIAKSHGGSGTPSQ